MASERRPLIAANWKMNGLKADGAALALALTGLAAVGGRDADILVCPPATLLSAVAECLAGSRIALGAQDCHAKPSGAFTGDIAAPMLRDAGCSFVIVGHSERRAGHSESDDIVRAKAEAALAADLNVIICVGETEAQRLAGEASSVVGRQLAGSIPANGPADRLVIAYEPVWAIGTGRTPTLDDIDQMHRHVRALLARQVSQGGTMRVLYGGSVKSSNARQVLGIPDVDGALVGGASLDAKEFWAIVSAAR